MHASGGSWQMSVPRILLLSGEAPGEFGVGAMYLRDLCLHYPRGSLCCFAVKPPHLRVPSPDLDYLPIANGSQPRERAVTRLGPRFERLTSFPLHQYSKRVRVSALIAQAVRFAKQHDVNMVWAVLDRLTLIYMARKVATKLGVRLVTTVWDPPEYLSTHRFHLDRLTRRAILSEFGKALRASARCGVMCEAMKDEYETKYGTESVVMRYGIHPDKWRPSASETTGKKQFVTGFAGSLYAVSEWKALLSALSKLDWQIDGRDIIVRVMGHGMDLRGTTSEMHIEYLGSLSSVDDVIEKMSHVDVAYLPIWFDESYRLFVRQSFPTKLATYLAAGRPVFFHGPEDSSPAHFFRRFPVGLCCHSMEEPDIIECLRRFASDREFYATATAAGKAALEQELSLHVFLRQFAMLIGVATNQLLPI